MIFKKTLAVGVAALALIGCAPVDMLNTLTPSKGFSLTKDTQFSQSPALNLDVYTPSNAEKANAPIVMFIYGGGWNSGNKDMYKFIGEAFSSEGYTTVIPNYRVYPDVIYPDFMEDAAKAVKWTADTYKRPIVLVGHSAGAHISALLALNPDYLGGQSLDRCETLAGWVGLAGPYDFKVIDPPYTQIFPKSVRQEILPINYVDNSVMPALTVIGKADTTVSPAQTERMSAALEAVGTPVTASYYEGVSHTDIIAQMSKLFQKRGQVHSDVMAFIDGLPAKPSCTK